ncbi:MAG: exodeoxyribonuclease VII large subunit [Clostridia bacterium]|nr:exodeoxyribonuclease VII large subunit [Clostridia bacterium]
MEREVMTVSVSQLNHYIYRVIEHNSYLKDICIKGEISNFKRHPSGHIYLTLKDEASTLRTVMFRSAASSLRFQPEDGMRVIARGRISVYEAGGTYQLYIERMDPDGEGALYLAYEKLKKGLEAEGLFDPAFKKPLPAYPKTVSVVTASSGAAVRDILNILKRRYPIADVKLFPVMVQGEGSAQQIAEAIRLLNEKELGDVIIVGRGGGSIEDLWSFNEEIVARAIFASKIPIISAVGHETDFTIADFVADLRAPTPSAAAELAVPDMAELAQRIAGAKSALFTEMRHALLLAQKSLDNLSKHPAMTGFSGRIAEKRILTDQLMKDGQNALTRYLEKHRHALSVCAGKLNALSPLAALSRGYAYASLPDGTALRSVEQLAEGNRFQLRLADGTAQCKAETVNQD